MPTNHPIDPRAAHFISRRCSGDVRALARRVATLAPTLRWTMGRDDACVRVVDSRGAPLLKVHGDHIRFRVATTTPVPMFGREASRNQASRYIAVDSRATSDHDLKRLLAAAERHDPPARGADVGSRTRRRTPLQVCAACGLELPLSGRCDCTD